MDEKKILAYIDKNVTQQGKLSGGNLTSSVFDNRRETVTGYVAGEGGKFALNLIKIPGSSEVQFVSKL